MMEALIAYADYIFFRSISLTTIQNIFFIYYSSEPDDFICLLAERLNTWPHKNIYILHPKGIWKYEFGLYQTIESQENLGRDYPGIIINLTWPPFSPHEWAPCMKELLKRLQQSCGTCSVPVAHQEWADKLFSQDIPEARMEKLWRVILSYFPNPFDCKNAFQHLDKLIKQAKYLTKQHFEAIHITNDEGTDLTVELHPNHLWVTSCENEYCTNIPINEIYTVPIKDGVNGQYICSGPMEINGIIVKNIELHFKSGKAKILKAEGDYARLEQLLNTDYGSRYMGEIALVMQTEVKSERKSTLNSLLDENIFCHFALGNAYAKCIVGGNKKSTKDLLREKVNISTIHADFWFSSRGLMITGILNKNRNIPVIYNGESVL